MRQNCQRASVQVACMTSTGTLRAKRGERDILREARDEGKRKFIFQLYMRVHTKLFAFMCHAMPFYFQTPVLWPFQMAFSMAAPLQIPVEAMLS